MKAEDPLAEPKVWPRVTNMIRGSLLRSGVKSCARDKGKLDIVLLQQMAERAIRHLQQLSGTGLHTTGLLQGRCDQRPFNISDIFFKVNAIRGNAGSMVAIG